MLTHVLGLDKITVDKEFLSDVTTNLKYNKPIIKFYKRLLFNTRFNTNVGYRERIKAGEHYHPEIIKTNLPYVKVTTLENTIANLSNCNNLWLLNVYDTQKVKDFLKTNLCKDRFCANCKKVKQASRMSRFIPEIEKYKDRNLYHLTLTAGPNMKGKLLRETVDRMTKSFARLTEYFKGRKKIRGLDFEKYGYEGAIRSLEVTFKGDSYHPHFHCLMVLNWDDTQKDNINQFSKRHGKIARKFSDLEILVQKIWKLLVDGKKVTLANINSLDFGYSATMDEFEQDHYNEIFKYMTKTGNGEDGEFFTYDNFVTLYFELKGVRQIQGYGCFFRIKDEDCENEVDDHYNLIIDTLDSIEVPRVATESTKDLYFDEEYTLISRKKVYSYLREIEQKEKDITVAAISPVTKES